MNTTPSDAQDAGDMSRLAGGRDDALNDLMARHGARLFHYLIRLLQDEMEAADLAQEAFVRVYLNRAKFRPGSRFSTWLFTIATNLARDRLRRLTRHPHVSLDGGVDDAPGLKEVIPGTEPSPAERIEGEERAAAVRRAVADLPEELRVPLVLAEFEGQSHAEIAAILGCSAKAVETRIYRARQRLRGRLSGWMLGAKNV